MPSFVDSIKGVLDQVQAIVQENAKKPHEPHDKPVDKTDPEPPVQPEPVQVKHPKVKELEDKISTTFNQLKEVTEKAKEHKGAKDSLFPINFSALFTNNKLCYFFMPEGKFDAASFLETVETKLKCVNNRLTQFLEDNPSLKLSDSEKTVDSLDPILNQTKDFLLTVMDTAFSYTEKAISSVDKKAE